VPSTPAIGSEAISSGITGLCQAARSRLAKAFGRDALAARQAGAVVEYQFRQFQTLRLQPAGNLAARAIGGRRTLAVEAQEQLARHDVVAVLVDVTNDLAERGDSCTASVRAPAGARPARTRPLKLPPSSCHRARKSPSTWTSAARAHEVQRLLATGGRKTAAEFDGQAADRRPDLFAPVAAGLAAGSGDC
jgi:hypothetical protein